MSRTSYFVHTCMKMFLVILLGTLMMLSSPACHSEYRSTSSEPSKSPQYHDSSTEALVATLLASATLDDHLMEELKTRGVDASSAFPVFLDYIRLHADSTEHSEYTLSNIRETLIAWDENSRGIAPGLARIVSSKECGYRSKIWALFILSGLGPNASEAIPDLRDILEKGDSKLHPRILSALVAIGCEGHAESLAPIVARSFSRRPYSMWEYSDALVLLESFGPKGDTAIPELQRAFNRGEPFGTFAASALSVAGDQGSQALDGMLACSEEQVRFNVAEGIINAASRGARLSPRLLKRAASAVLGGLWCNSSRLESLVYVEVDALPVLTRLSLLRALIALREHGCEDVELVFVLCNFISTDKRAVLDEFEKWAKATTDEVTLEILRSKIELYSDPVFQSPAS